MGFGRICCKMVLGLFLGRQYNDTLEFDSAITSVELRCTDNADETVTMSTASGSVTLSRVHQMGDLPTGITIGRFGTDAMSGYYLICGRTYIGGGIWDDGGSCVGPHLVAEDVQHFETALRAEFECIKNNLGLPATTQPEFKMFISYGQGQY